MSSLDQLAIRYGTDKSSQEHGYTKLYEKYLDPNFDGTLLEIGVAQGASVRMWAQWMPFATIIGVDTNPDVLDMVGNYHTICGDATDPKTLEAIFPDIVIDDGSHHAKDICKTLDILWDRLPVGGWYIIEDLETQFHEQWGGGDNGSTVIDRIYDFLNHALRGKGVSELHVYEQIIFMRKI